MQTPCVQVCEIDTALAVCRGCGRTLQEIGNWVRYSPSERLRIMRELPARQAQGTAERK
ncbi:MAG: DUF1289 domain-containing protein [Gammaproteobacteria bacterium]|nr:DUF1289 domain-containing protein [Gammaproteobacteria bacterium]